MEENEQQGFWELIKSIPVPDFIKHNAITALSKGIGKLIESSIDIPVSFFEQKSKIIRAEGDAKVKLIDAAAESAVKMFDSDTELTSRAFYYFGRKLVEQQFNREQVAIKTVEHLQEINTANLDEKSIDEDWLTQFWNLSETKSKDDVQEILSKVLAKEIAVPGSVSPYTLQLLSVLTSDIGNAFLRLSNLSIDDGASCYVIHPNVMAFQNIGPLHDYEVSYEDLFDLDGAGLIRSAETLRLNYGGEPSYDKVNYAGLQAELDLSGKQVHLIQFTKSGRELRNLLQLTECEKYTQVIKERLQSAFVLY